MSVAVDNRGHDVRTEERYITHASFSVEAIERVGRICVEHCVDIFFAECIVHGMSGRFNATFLASAHLK